MMILSWPRTVICMVTGYILYVLAMKNKYILLIPVDRVYLATDTIIYARIDSCLMGPIVCVVDALLVKI